MGRLYDYPNQEPSLISWHDVFKISHAGFLVDRTQFLQEITRIARELKRSPGIDKKIDQRTKLMLYGSVMTFDDTKVIDLVDKAGAKLVADALCTGSRFWRRCCS